MTSESDPSHPFSIQPLLPKPEERPWSLRERIAVDTLGRLLHTIKGVLGDAMLVAGLERRGICAAEFQTGVTLQTAAEEAFSTCRLSLSALDVAAETFNDAWVDAREEYLEFRRVARCLSDKFPARELHVGGTIAGEMVPFVAQAQASYAAAGKRSYLRALAVHGFTRTKLAGLIRELASLIELERALRALKVSVDRHLDDRDIALAMLNLWVRELLQHARMVAGATIRPPTDGASLQLDLESVRFPQPQREARNRTTPSPMGGRSSTRFRPLD